MTDKLRNQILATMFNSSGNNFIFFFVLSFLINPRSNRFLSTKNWYKKKERKKTLLSKILTKETNFNKRGKDRVCVCRETITSRVSKYLKTTRTSNGNGNWNNNMVNNNKDDIRCNLMRMMMNKYQILVVCTRFIMECARHIIKQKKGN